MENNEVNAIPQALPKAPVGIFFSGGIDSTLLVYNALQEGRDVYLFYANGQQSPIKKAAEEYARYRIKETLAKMKLPGRIVSDRTIDITGSVEAPKGSWIMTFFWFMSATQAIDLRLGMEEIQLGVIWGDELWGVMGFLETAWWNLMRATFVCMPEKDLPKLRAPLAYHSKYRVREELPEKLLKLTWYCEVPKWGRNKPKACGACQPCLKRALDDRLVNVERSMSDHILDDIPRFEAFMKERETVAKQALLASEPVPSKSPARKKIGPRTRELL